MKRGISLVIITLTFIFSTVQLNAANKGKFSRYTQLTDKEVLVESTKGIKVLFSAYDHHSIGMTYFAKNEKIQVILPSAIFAHVELNGSIYVEELDDMMQITTTSTDGLVVKIDKKHFGFTFIDKTTNQELLNNEELLTQIFTNENMLIVSNESNHTPNTL